MGKLPGLFVITTMLSACSWQEPPSQPEPTIAAAQVPRSPATVRPPIAEPIRAHDPGVVAATAAQQQIGIAYRYGGSDTRGFDCSGLVQYAYKQAGVSVPRTTRQQWSAVATVDEHSIRAGDVLFFDISGKPSHVGIYVGDGFFVHAPSTGRAVSTERLSARYYRERLIKIGRFAP